MTRQEQDEKLGIAHWRQTRNLQDALWVNICLKVGLTVSLIGNVILILALVLR